MTARRGKKGKGTCYVWPQLPTHCPISWCVLVLTCSFFFQHKNYLPNDFKYDSWQIANCADRCASMTVNRVPPLPQVFFLSVLWVCVYGCMRALKNHPPAFKPTPSPMHASSSLYASQGLFGHKWPSRSLSHTHTRTPVKYVRDRVTSVLCYFCSRSSGDTATIWRSTRSPRGLGKWGECTRMRFFFEKCQEKGSLVLLFCF